MGVKSTKHGYILFLILTLLYQCTKFQCGAVKSIGLNEIGISGHKEQYDDAQTQQNLEQSNPSTFRFQRFQSPSSVQDALNLNKKSPFKWFKGKDGRKGFVSCTRLGGDWVLAESKQVARKCTTDEVLRAYLSGSLQNIWNCKEVLDCKFKCKTVKDEMDGDYETKKKTPQRGSMFGVGVNQVKSRLRSSQKEKIESSIKNYYQQDLTLHSQRIIRSHTGIMKYTQILLIDKIGEDSYSVLVKLADPNQDYNTTKKKPFDSLFVYVNLQQNGDNVDIYAAGLMQVNRDVVPNLIIFDASGIAGGMAGKGTLWLAGYFDQRIS